MAERARANPDATFILVIDEINRGNVAKRAGRALLPPGVPG